MNAFGVNHAKCLPCTCPNTSKSTWSNNELLSCMPMIYWLYCNSHQTQSCQKLNYVAKCVSLDCSMHVSFFNFYRCSRSTILFALLLSATAIDLLYRGWLGLATVWILVSSSSIISCRNICRFRFRLTLLAILPSIDTDNCIYLFIFGSCCLICKLPHLLQHRCIRHEQRSGIV